MWTVSSANWLRSAIGMLRHDSANVGNLTSVTKLNSVVNDANKIHNWHVENLSLDDFRQLQLRRRSIRDWSSRPLEYGVFQSCCSIALSSVLAGVNFLILANNINNLPRGVYRCGNGLEPELLGKPDRDFFVDDLFLQSEFGSAPLVIFFTGSLTNIGESMHDYRNLMVNVGQSCQSFVLESSAMGLVGTIFAGLFIEPFQKMGLDGISEKPMLAYAFGRPLFDQNE